MIFGVELNKGIVLNGFKLEVVTIGENGITEDDILVHNVKEQDPTFIRCWQEWTTRISSRLELYEQ